MLCNTRGWGCADSSDSSFTVTVNPDGYYYWQQIYYPPTVYQSFPSQERRCNKGKIMPQYLLLSDPHYKCAKCRWNPENCPDFEPLKEEAK